MAKISVIIPLYNQGHFLKDSVKSLREQSFQDWEGIIVNDGSTDDSLHQAEECILGDRRFKIVDRSNGGLAAARNTGLRHAVGKYIALLDSDDYLLPHHLSHLMSVMESAPDAVVTVGRTQETNEQFIPIGKFRLKDNNLQEDRLSESLLRANPLGRIVWNNPSVTCSQLWRGDFLSQNHYDESLRSNEDWDILWRAANLKHQVSCCGEVVSYYRRHGDSLNWNIEQMIRSRMAAYWKNSKYLGESSIERKCADLSTVLSLMPLSSDSPHRHGVRDEFEYHVENLYDILGDKMISRFAILWCCGALRRNRLTRDHVHYKLWWELTKILMSCHATYVIGARSAYERLRYSR